MNGTAYQAVTSLSGQAFAFGKASVKYVSVVLCEGHDVQMYWTVQSKCISGALSLQFCSLALVDLPPTLQAVSELRKEMTMRTRPREVVRMLAAFRHAAHCRSVREARAQEEASRTMKECEETRAAEIASENPPRRTH
jgi:hypothetical protein